MTAATGPKHRSKRGQLGPTRPAVDLTLKAVDFPFEKAYLKGAKSQRFARGERKKYVRIIGNRVLLKKMVCSHTCQLPHVGGTATPSLKLHH